MRPIKFRAWDGKLMHNVSELHFCMGPKLDGKGLKFYGPGVGEGWIDGENIILMQYTGLKDKNGKKIYEGDYLRIHQFLFDGNEFENELTGEVVYDNETCSFALKNIVNDGVKKYMGYQKDEDCGNIPIFNFYGLHEESFEVVGNIYEQVGDTP